MESASLQTPSFRNAGGSGGESGGISGGTTTSEFLLWGGGADPSRAAASLTSTSDHDPAGAGHAGDSNARAHGPRPEPGPVSGPTLLPTRSSGSTGLDNNAAGPVHVSTPLHNVSAPSFTSASSCPRRPRSEWRASYLNRPLPPIPRRPVATRARSSTGLTLFPRVITYSGTDITTTIHNRSRSVSNIDIMSRIDTMGPGRGDRSKRMSRDDMFLGRSTTLPTSTFNKRISRDDMDLGRWSKAASSRAGPPPTTRGHQFADSQSSIQYEPPVLSTMRESTLSAEIPIGMALGSPSHAPAQFSMGAPAPQVQSRPASRWQPQISTESLSSSPARPPSAAGTAANSAPVPQRTKTKRKLFGIFSSKKEKQPQQQLSQSQPSIRRPGTSGTISRDSSITVTTSANPSFNPATPGRSATVTNNRATPRYQPIIVRTNTEPFGPASGNAQGLPQRPTLKSKISEPAIRQPGLAMPTFNLQPPSDSKFQSSYLGASGAVHLAGGANGKPFLPLDLPDYKMERYSVMFSGLLNPKAEAEKKKLEEAQKQQQQPPQSLLMRRQATLKELKTIDEKVAREQEARMHSRQDSTISGTTLANSNYTSFNGNNDYINPAQRQRRATSPQPTKSPAFVLFPPPPSAKKLSPVPGLSRSNTSPAILPSPIRSTFEQPREIPRRPVEQPQPQPREKPTARQQIQSQSQDNYLGVTNPLRSNPNPTYSYYSTNSASNSHNDPHRGTAPGSIFSPSQSSLILDSPTSISSPSDYDDRSPYTATAAQGPLKPAIVSPQWQMVTAASSSNPSSTSSSEEDRDAFGPRRPSSPPSSISSTQTYHTHNWPQPPSSEKGAPSVSIDETDPALKSAVESSIARQISLSRQQRQLLRPLQTQAALPGQIKRKPSRPVVVQVESPVMGVGMAMGGSGSGAQIFETKTSTPTLVTPPGSGRDERWRKSERVVLEAA